MKKQTVRGRHNGGRPTTVGLCDQTVKMCAGGRLPESYAAHGESFRDE